MIDKTSDQFLLDAYSGKGGFKDGSYLVAHPRESDDKFARRKELAVYPNYCRKILNVFIGFLWAQAPQRGDTSDLYNDFLENSDGKGTALDAVLRDYQRLAVIMGTVYIIVDKSTEEAATRADEPLPYLTVRFKSQVEDEVKDRFGEWESITFRETSGNENLLRTFTRDGWRLEKDKQIIDRGEYSLGRVPVVALHADKPLNPTDSSGDSFFFDLAQLNWDLFNLRSELRELLRSQTFSILSLPVATDKERESLKDLTISTENALAYNPANGGKPDFIAPPADPVNAYVEKVADTRLEIYQVANLEFVGGVQQSGVALSFHFQEANSSLRTLAEQCEVAEKEICDLVHLWQGQEAQGYIAYNNDFNLSDLAQSIAAAMDSVTLGLGETFERVIKKRIAKQILGNDVPPEDMAQIETEIDADGDVYADRMQQELGERDV